MAKNNTKTNVKNPTKDEIGALTKPIHALIKSAPVSSAAIEVEDDSIEVSFRTPGSIEQCRVRGFVFNGIWIARVEIPGLAALDEATTIAFGQLVQTLLAIQSIIADA